MDIEALRALEARLVEAKRPDRKIEDDIATHILGWRYVEKWSRDGEGERVLDIAEWRDEKYQYAMCPDAYTSSLDAAVALAERVLPGWRRSSDNFKGSWTVELRKPADGYSVDFVWNEHFFGSSTVEALALCLAIVRALIAKEQG